MKPKGKKLSQVSLKYIVPSLKVVHLHEHKGKVVYRRRKQIVIDWDRFGLMLYKYPKTANIFIPDE